MNTEQIYNLKNIKFVSHNHLKQFKLASLKLNYLADLFNLFCFMSLLILLSVHLSVLRTPHAYKHPRNKYKASLF